MIDNKEFANRRRQLADQMLEESICIVPAARLQRRSRDTDYPFRQDSDFHYLTNFPEPDALLIVSNSEQFGGLATALFCLDKDPTAEIWHGRRFGPEQAKVSFGFDEAYPLDEVESSLIDLVDGHQHLYFPQGLCTETDELVYALVKALREAPKQSRIGPVSMLDSRQIVHAMRLVKSEAELAVMQRAGDISAIAHKRAMEYCQPGQFEYQLEAELHHEFAMKGARHPAYGTIVGSGDNACILHYTENQDELKDGDLVLIDAGGELHGYAADITRTFPVNGKFTDAQSQIYNLVLEAQLQAMALLKPGSTLKQATDCSIAVITGGLIELGILTGDLEDNIEQQTYRDYYMHGLSHWLGLDVHDVGDYKIAGFERSLEPGMVFTVEPGIYISPTANVDEKWRGIGVRIEDNVVITETGYKVMTDAVPKTIKDIEALMAGGSVEH